MAPPSIPRKPVGSRAKGSVSEIELVQSNATNESATASLLAHKQEESTTIHEPKKSKRLSDYWAVELVAWVVSVLSIVGVVIILLLYNNRILGHWPLPISLNTLISVLSQLGQTALIIPIAACIGQLKWLWFIQPKSPRTLADFEAFDDASRGPWASLLLIWRTHAGHLVSLGAALAIATLGFQPFTQQTVSFVQRLTPSGTAQISSCSNLTKNYLTGENNLDVPLTYWAAIYNTFGDPIQSLSDITASCSTGNCTFDLYHSLAICPYPVANLTSQLTATANSGEANCSKIEMKEGLYLPNCTYSLSNGMFLNTLEYEMNITSSNGISSIAYPNMNQSLPLDFFVIYYSNNTNRIEALECAMRFCGQTYNSSVHSGQTVTTLTDTWGKLTVLPSQLNGVDTYYILEGGPTTFTVDSNIPWAMATPAEQIFQGLNSFEQMGEQFRDEWDMYQVSSGAQAIWSTLTASDEMAAMTTLMKNMAISLTNSLRTSQGTNQITGTTFAMEIYVSVRYEWLIFPIALVLLTLFFLLATMMKSRHHGIPLWKSSSLAVLGGLDRETREELGNVRSVGDMVERAKEAIPTMRRRDHGWSLGIKE